MLAQGLSPYFLPFLISEKWLLSALGLSQLDHSSTVIRSSKCVFRLSKKFFNKFHIFPSVAFAFKIHLKQICGRLLEKNQLTPFCIFFDISTLVYFPAAYEILS